MCQILHVTFSNPNSHAPTSLYSSSHSVLFSGQNYHILPRAFILLPLDLSLSFLKTGSGSIHVNSSNSSQHSVVGLFIVTSSFIFTVQFVILMQPYCEMF